MENNKTQAASVNGSDSGAIQDLDGGYRWVCLPWMLLITANTWGVNGVGQKGHH